jgi:hypothetical protein
LSITKSHMTRPEFEPGPPRWEAGDWPPELWRNPWWNLHTHTHTHSNKYMCVCDEFDQNIDRQRLSKHVPTQEPRNNTVEVLSVRSVWKVCRGMTFHTADMFSFRFVSEINSFPHDKPECLKQLMVFAEVIRIWRWQIPLANGLLLLPLLAVGWDIDRNKWHPSGHPREFFWGRTYTAQEISLSLPFSPIFANSNRLAKLSAPYCMDTIHSRVKILQKLQLKLQILV